jgi:hypothetical protein
MTQRSQPHYHHIIIVTAILSPHHRRHHRACLAHTSSSSHPWHTHPHARNADVATTTMRRSQPHYRHIVIFTAPAWRTPRPHPALGAWPARLRVRNGNVATTTTQRLQPHYCHVIIVTAVLRCAHTHASYRSLHTTHACPPSLHIRKLPYMYAGFENGDLSNHMFFLLFLCFLPMFHIICVYKYVVIYYGTLCEHGICVLKDSTGK